MNVHCLTTVFVTRELLYDDGHNHVVSRECFLTLGDKSEIDITIMDAWCLALNAKEREQSVPR